ncbi:MAG: DUF427 domain-containing protein [Gammaproteobacteria bacterium]|nr:DUF427 domain-containing protein [Gammaproteobacteria bacterium]
MEILAVTDAAARARAKWRFRGDDHPEFALRASRDEESVWDYPRPPRIAEVAQPLRVLCGELLIAETTVGLRVMETAGAPTYYFPPEDVYRLHLTLQEQPQSSCEWKGVAVSFSVAGVRDAAWSYRATYPEFTSICGWFAFFPARLECFIGAERAVAQAGGYYGGWVTGNLCGPIKGEPGTEHW